MRRRLRGLIGSPRAALVALTALAATALLLSVVHPHYPIQRWLLWRYVEAWAYTLGFGLSCLGLGLRLAGPLLSDGVPALRERLLFEMGVGVVAFFVLVFLGGLVGVIGPVFSTTIMSAGILAGAPVLLQRATRIAAHWRAARARPRPPRPWWHVMALVAGGLSLSLVYFSILSPNNAAFDARFYHLAIAEQYAVTGAIRPPPEIWWPAALPHLASVLYAWCFSLPRLDMFSRVVCAAHLELLLFLITLAALGIVARRIVPPARKLTKKERSRARAPRLPVAWVAVFLFPGIFLYDSALSVAADHVTAFFAVPIFLALLRIWRRPSWRGGVLLAVLSGGALLTKYQAIYLVAPVALALISRALWRSLRSLRRGGPFDPVAKGTWLALGVALVAGLVVTAPHWLKNWVFYGNPVFPNLLSFFSLDAYPEGSARIYDVWKKWQTSGWVPQASTAVGKVQETGEALVTFSFVPHDWAPFHGARPVFGSLFTFSILVLPFLRRTKRVWALLGATYLGLVVWYVTLHQDRYLQILLPWMAVVVAATIALCWREGALSRFGIGILVAAQIVWGGDVYFLPAHMVTKEPPTVTTTRLLAAGHAGEYEERLHLTGVLFELGRHPDLPDEATVLLHEVQERTGLRRPVVSDLPGYQLMLRYELEPSAKTLHDRLRQMGVTHIFVAPFTSYGTDSLGADLRFFDFVFHDTQSMLTIDSFVVFELVEPPPAEPTRRVAYLGCSEIYEPGLHDLSSLDVRDLQLESVNEPRRAEVPLASSSPGALLAQADFAVTDPACAIEPSLLGDFAHLAKRGEESLWGRRREREQRGGGVGSRIRGLRKLPLQRMMDR